MTNYEASRFIRNECSRVMDRHIPTEHFIDSLLTRREILDEYEKPHRVYHTESHLADVLRQLRRWERWLTLTEYLTAFAALLCHDVVHDLPEGDRSNEEQSGLWAFDFVYTSGLYPIISPSQVRDLVGITQGHQPEDFVGLVVSWCDLWGFTKSAKKSATYSEQIRAEYLKAYTVEQYNQGRRVFLTSYRNPFKVYRGAPLRLRIAARILNFRANRNLDRELRELDN